MRLHLAIVAVLALTSPAAADGLVFFGSSRPTGPAAGDLSGTFPNPSVAKVLGTTPGTGVLAAFGINIGSAGSFILNGGALGTPASGVATNLTGTAAGLTAGNATLAATVTTNANMTGDVTSVGNATTIGANKVSRAMEAQGVARSIIGVTGNAAANVADIQGTADQALVINSAGTALAFGKVNLAAGAGVTGVLPVANGGWGDAGTAWGTYTPTLSCGSGTFTSASAAGRFKTVGKTTFVNIVVTITTNGTCGAFIGVTLPNTTVGASFIGGRSSSGNLVGGQISGAGTVLNYSGATGSYVGSDGTTTVLNGVYENQ
jgi:hypothetical protein